MATSSKLARVHWVWCYHSVRLLEGYNASMTVLHHRLLEGKRKELGDAASKLRNGLSKLIETREKVEAMTIELEGAKVKLAQFQKECDEYLVSIVQQKRDAEEQEKVRQRKESGEEERSMRVPCICE